MPRHALPLLLLATALGATDAPTARLSLQPLGSQSYMPSSLHLSDTRPSGITKEPVYRGTPQYSTLRLGNGPRATYTLVMDRPEEGDDRIYIDRNQNGDLTDDGDGAWGQRSEREGRISYSSRMVLRASYGKASAETSSAEVTVNVYASKGNDRTGFYLGSRRVGNLVMEGKSFEVELRENDGDALFHKPAATVEEAKKTRPVLATFRRASAEGKPEVTVVDIRGPFNLEGRAYEAQVTDDGASLTLRPTSKPVVNLTPPPPPRPKLLAVGAAAPEYTVEKWGGGSLKLSELRGKVVILDFWATWCGPCQQSMPHLEELYKATLGKGVEVLAACVWDGKGAYEKWVPANRSRYTFPMAFDASGRGEASQASRLWNVSGIPTTYVIDKEGKVAEAIVGFDKSDKRIEAALKRLGIAID